MGCSVILWFICPIIFQVYGDKDADGFYKGESGGRIGFIPCNMVSEIQVDDPELEEQLLKEVHENGSMATSGETTGHFGIPLQ